MASVEPAPGRPGGGPGAPEGAEPGIPLAAWVAAGGALVVVVGLGAGAGPLILARPARPLAFGRPSSRPGHPTSSTTAVPPGPAHPAAPPHTAGSGSSGVAGWVIVGVLVMLAAAAAVTTSLRWVREGRLREVSRPAVAVDPTPPAGEAVPDVGPALSALEDESSPRGAVLACWLRLEEAVAGTGAARAPAETSGELTRRVLTAHAVDPSGLARLHALYLQARFAAAPVTPAAPGEARRILQDVRAQLDGARAGAAP